MNGPRLLVFTLGLVAAVAGCAQLDVNGLSPPDAGVSQGMAGTPTVSARVVAP